MKKIIFSIATLFLGIGLANSSGISNDNLIQLNDFNSETKEVTSVTRHDGKILSARRVSVPTRALTTGIDFSGEWVFTIIDNVLDSSTGETLNVPFTCELERVGSYDFWFFSDPNNEYFPFVGLYEDDALVFYADIIATAKYQGSMCYISQEPYYYDETIVDGGMQWLESISCDYDAEKDTLTFGEDTGLLWGLYGDIDNLEDTFIGWLDGYDFLGAVRKNNPGAGIEGINICENEKTMYYNLQGIRIESPVKGETTIVKQGRKTQKIIY